MTKKIGFLALFFLMVFGIMGCTGQTTTTTTVAATTTTTTSGPTASNTLSIPDLPAAPSTFTLTGTVLSWNPVDGATGYLVEASGSSYNQVEPNIDLSQLEDGFFYVITVKSMSGDNAGAASSPYYYNKDVALRATYTYTYDVTNQSGLDIATINDYSSSLYVADATMKNAAELFAYGDDNVLSMSAQTLSSLAEGQHVYTLYYETDKIVINVTIENNQTLPYLLSSSTVYVVLGNDVTARFELFGGSIVSVSGNEMTASDYTVSGSTFTVDGAYIQKEFDNYPSRTVLIITFMLEDNQGNVQMGIISIYQQS